VSSVKLDVAFARVDVRPMHELDIPVVAAIEKAAYQFPWSEGIFRDCLRVGYVCRIIDVAGDVGGYGIMSVGAGEAHILNVCIRDEYRSRGFARKVMLYLLERARAAGMSEAYLEVRPSNVAAITKRASAAKTPRFCVACSTPT
jgi:ribosomal-protein-alanine N-acetyltransferase